MGLGPKPRRYAEDEPPLPRFATGLRSTQYGLHILAEYERACIGVTHI